VAPETDKRGKDILEKLESANVEANIGFFRMALKLASGAGKTTVMAMLIAWQTINAARHPGSSRFTKGVLVVEPGLTIRDRFGRLSYCFIKCIWRIKLIHNPSLFGCIIYCVYSEVFSSIITESMSDIKAIIDALIKFRNERDWGQFHNPKDLAVAINIEASELLENFLWKSNDEANQEKVKEELADVLAYSFLLAEKYGFNIKDILLDKIKKNAEKYPVDKSKGTAKKYNQLK